MWLRAIFARDEDGVIWNKGKMPRNEKADLIRFKKLVKWKICLMWKATYESLKDYWKDAKWYPHASKNIVISSSMESEPWIEVIRSIDELKEKYKDEVIYLLWWASAFNRLMPYIDEIYETLVKGKHEWDAKIDVFEEKYWFKEYHPTKEDEKNDKYYDERYDEDYDREIERTNPTLQFRRLWRS